ncbi:MAG: hypothetical protein JO316_19445 [Abitibacteriaceae bacterium]|nr:hypothetical protein [Abditibacteriaceae bacterium]MBV9867532.1 hypothetical protein [Abditibacteriaceae bacterium]
MFIKFFLLSGLLLIAYGFAVILLRRLTSCRDRLLALQEQMARNDAQLHAQMQRLREVQEAQLSASANGSNGAAAAQGTAQAPKTQPRQHEL